MAKPRALDEVAPRVCATALTIALSGCAFWGSGATPHGGLEFLAGERVELPDSRSGVLRVLTYNVAGLPEWLSASTPSMNNLHASHLLNAYDLVLAQEDFAYHDDLVQRALHPYRLSPLDPVATLFGDGLCALSVYPLERVRRVRWVTCSGYLSDASDCFGEKGFSVAQVVLSRDVGLHVYNLHADAGDSRADVEARRRGFRQLARFIERHSDGRAVILAGDTNLDAEHDARDQATLDEFTNDSGLVDACAVTRCGVPSVDRIFYRGSTKLSLQATDYYEDRRFVDAQGRALSDHVAIAANLAWVKRQR